MGIDQGSVSVVEVASRLYDHGRLIESPVISCVSNAPTGVGGRLPRSLLLKCGGVAAVLVAVASPLPLFAGEGLYLDWGLCGPTGAVQQSFACDSNIGSENLYCAFTLATPLDQVLGVEIVIDIVHSQSVLPSWWQLGVGAAVTGRWRPMVSLRRTGIARPSGPVRRPGDQLYEVGQPRNAANQARIVVALSLLPPDARTLAAGTLYYAARVLLENQNTTGAGSCSGCGGDACLVLKFHQDQAASRRRGRRRASRTAGSGWRQHGDVAGNRRQLRRRPGARRLLGKDQGPLSLNRRRGRPIPWRDRPDGSASPARGAIRSSCACCGAR